MSAFAAAHPIWFGFYWGLWIGCGLIALNAIDYEVAAFRARRLRVRPPLQENDNG